MADNDQDALEPLELEPIELYEFTLAELSTPLAQWPEDRRAAYADAACLDGACTVGLPPAWERAVRRMPERAHGVAPRYLTETGVLKPELQRFNEGSLSAIAPVWPSDRTKAEDPAQFLPQRSIFVRLEKLWDVYQDPELVLGFLIKQLVRSQVLCRHLELLGIPEEAWTEATGGALGSDWQERAPQRLRELDELASDLVRLERNAHEPAGEPYQAWAARVEACWRAFVEECRGWNWASVNFYLYDDGADLRRTPIRRIVDRQGNTGFAATLLVEHADYDYVASVANSQGGLQAKDRDGQWRTVPPGPLLLNTGKAMQLLAGGSYSAGEVVGGGMRAIPHRVVLQGPTAEAVRSELESLQKRISIVGVTEPDGDEARLLTWDAARRELVPAPGLEHCKFWQFLVHKVPEAAHAE